MSEYDALDEKKFTTITVSQMEYEALLNVEQVLRICLVNPHVGEILSVAIHALDAVRRDQGIQSNDRELVNNASDITKNLIQRAKK